jgi:hypothetical protein
MEKVIPFSNRESHKANRPRHCDYLREDPLHFLSSARKEDIMVFREWILDNSNIKKFSSLHEIRRQWCQLYRKAVGRSLHAKCSQDINDVSASCLPVMLPSSFLLKQNTTTVHERKSGCALQSWHVRWWEAGYECRRPIHCPPPP